MRDKGDERQRGRREAGMREKDDLQFSPLWIPCDFTEKTCLCVWKTRELRRLQRREAKRETRGGDETDDL